MELKLLRSSMKKYIIFSLFFFNLCLSQNEESFSPDINPQTPEISSLLKYIETPVSHNSGLINLNIPMYEIKEGDIIYPISISYNSSGVLVNERAGWLGMGFSLSQPQIIRNIKGQPDDFGGFIYENQHTYQNILNWEQLDISTFNANWNQTYRLATEGVIDLESDEYIVMLPNGESFKFYFSQNRTIEKPYGEIIQIPISNKKILPIFNNSHFIGWNIIDELGNSYEFEVGNRTIITESYTVNNDLPTKRGASSKSDYATAWILKKINSSKGNELNFIYENFYFEDCNLVDQNRIVDKHFIQADGAQLNLVETNYQSTKGYLSLIKEISGKFGKVTFNTDSLQREDYTFGKKLKEIVILDKSNSLINQYNFIYDYSTSDNPSGNIYTCSATQYNNDLIKRMFLTKILILGNNNSTLNKPFYQFNYNNIELPHRFSYDVDWWGYYNGPNNNLSLVPTILNEDINMPNRDVNPMYSKAGLLDEVIFPTGGITKYEFESNRGVLESAILEEQTGFTTVRYNSTENLVPSVYRTKNFNVLGSNPVQQINTNGGVLKKYHFDLLIEDDMIGYYVGELNPFINVRLPLGLNVNCTTCLLDENSLPQGGECYVKYILKKDNIILFEKYLTINNSTIKFPLEIALANQSNPISILDLKLEVEIFTGNPTSGGEIFTSNDNVYFEFNWKVINNTIVRKTENPFFYEIPIGGHRIKSIKTFKNSGEIAINREFIYKNEQNYDSGIVNYKLQDVTFHSGVVKKNSNNYFPLKFYGGQSTGYTDVKEKIIDSTIEQIISHKYLFLNNNNNCYMFSNSFGIGQFPCFEDPINGKQLESKIGAEKNISYSYNNPFPNGNIKYIKGFNVFNKIHPDFNADNDWDFARYEIANFYKTELFSTTTIENFSSDSLISSSNFLYNNISHLQLTSQSNSTSSGDTIETKYSYAHEENNTALISKNMIGIPLKTEVKRNGELLSTQKTDYKDWSNNLLAPEIIKTAKGNQPLEDRIKYNVLDTTNGNPLEIEQIGGIKVCYIWGYNKTQPIAKIENATYAEVQPHVANLQTLSDGNNEQNLITALNNLRTALPNAMITTYTYKSLVGISTVTDPKGDKQTYHYDSFNRLQFVKDAQGNILSENQYHYRTQN